MKKIILLICSSVIAVSMMGQRNQNISVEALGAQQIVGLNYDMRFKGNEGFGFRVGAGFGYYTSEDFFLPTDVSEKGVAFPVEVNYLYGKRKHKLEVGLGASLGCYRAREYEIPEAWPRRSTKEESRYEEFWHFGYQMFANIGYRYQPVQGLMFRVGLTPSFNFGEREWWHYPRLENHAIKRSWLSPFVGIGWSF